MEIWIDAHLSPSLALWLNQHYPGIQAKSMRSLGLRDADDLLIFQQAKAQQAVIMSKDADFIKLQERLGVPPQIIWITAGNTSIQRMREIFEKHFPAVIRMLQNGEPLIEVEGS